MGYNKTEPYQMKLPTGSKTYVRAFWPGNILHGKCLGCQFKFLIDSDGMRR